MKGLSKGRYDETFAGEDETILGNREHKKTNFRFLGNRGTSQFISGEQGSRYPPWEGLFSILIPLFARGFINQHRLGSAFS